jgi:hypothetical protein
LSTKVTLEQIIAEAQQLPAEDRLRLIQRVAETLLPTRLSGQRRQLEYGKFAGANASSDADFEIAEWRPTERDLSGP